MWRQREARAAKRWHHRATSERRKAKPQHVVSLPAFSPTCSPLSVWLPKTRTKREDKVRSLWSKGCRGCSRPEVPTLPEEDSSPVKNGCL